MKLLDGINMIEKLDAAAAWCKEQGADSVADIKEAKEEQATRDRFSRE